MATEGASELGRERVQLHEIIHRYYTNDLLQRIDDKKLNEIATQCEAISQYSHENFSEDLLSDEEKVILTLSIRAANPSPEMSTIAKDPSYMEVKRTLSRFHCISLLQKGEPTYHEFIAFQKESKFNPPLTLQEYREVSKKYQDLDQLTLKALKLATLISSVPLSSEARKRADAIFGKDKYLVDTVEFPANVFEDIAIARQIYPQVEAFFNELGSNDEKQRATKLLQSAFSHHRHYRHMLYTEGSKNMFNTLLADLAAQKLDKEAYDFWVLYWTTNITGFRGHVEQPNGSRYLTSDTFSAMSALESVLERVFEEKDKTAKQLLEDYLKERANMLGLANIKNTGLVYKPQTREFLAHIGAMMRLYHPEQGQLLSAAYLVCGKSIEPLCKDFFAPDETMPTPTYAPALFENVKNRLLERYDQEPIFNRTKHINSKHLNVSAQEFKELLVTFETIVLCLPIYLKALDKYKERRAQKEINENIPLSFQAIANQKWVEALFNKSVLLDKVNILDLIDIKVSENGVVSYEKVPDYEQKLKAQQEAPDIVYADDLFEPKRVHVPGFSAHKVLASTAVQTAVTVDEKMKLGMK